MLRDILNNKFNTPEQVYCEIVTIASMKFNMSDTHQEFKTPYELAEAMRISGDYTVQNKTYVLEPGEHDKLFEAWNKGKFISLKLQDGGVISLDTTDIVYIHKHPPVKTYDELLMFDKYTEKSVNNPIIGMYTKGE